MTDFYFVNLVILMTKQQSTKLEMDISGKWQNAEKRGKNQRISETVEYDGGIHLS